MPYSKREHELALATAIAMTTADYQMEKTEAKANNKKYDPNNGIEIFEQAYQHALKYYSGNYPD
ncbi:hypothetical protein [Loigolactobacillus rennini]|uniref:Uncharacterized protein n=1 Tax=Loigolactobacillus rennini DSM 20253 TaxID=1423796 RepID=A0A0R2D098_9LACO|nr:hypothetical protein [Loigolactobacillus rennini]KRM93372.1 hypothetical protein FC24_GL000461 [Loigolactobacillus rennini DSM 20253]